MAKVGPYKVQSAKLKERMINNHKNGEGEYM